MKSNSDGLYIYTPDSGTISFEHSEQRRECEDSLQGSSGTLTLSETTLTRRHDHQWRHAERERRGSDQRHQRHHDQWQWCEVCAYVQHGQHPDDHAHAGRRGRHGHARHRERGQPAGNTITNGNGGSGALTIGTLSFAGAGTININEANTTAGLALTTFTTANTGLGEITINATNSSGWSSGTTYDLITFTSFTGSLSDFTQGTNLGHQRSPERDARRFGDGHHPRGRGGQSGVDRRGQPDVDDRSDQRQHGPQRLGAQDRPHGHQFRVNDAVEFNDTYDLGSGPVAVTNSTATIHGGVAPVSTAFNNSAVDYTINSDDSTGITSGVLSKSGTGTVTLNTVNTYNGRDDDQRGHPRHRRERLAGGGQLRGGDREQWNLHLQKLGHANSLRRDFRRGGVNVTGSGALTLSGANTFLGAADRERRHIEGRDREQRQCEWRVWQQRFVRDPRWHGHQWHAGIRWRSSSVTTSKVFTLAAGGTGTIQVDNASVELKLTAANGLTGSGQLIKTGLGQLAMGDAGHDFSGGVVIANGNLQGGNNNNSFGTGRSPSAFRKQQQRFPGLGQRWHHRQQRHYRGFRIGNAHHHRRLRRQRDLQRRGHARRRRRRGERQSRHGLCGQRLVAAHPEWRGIRHGQHQHVCEQRLQCEWLGRCDPFRAQNQTGAISSIDAPGGVANPTHGVNTISARWEPGLPTLTQNSANSTLMLSGDNSAFTGTVTVTQGTLTVTSDTGSGAVTVNGGTLQVNGSVSGALAVNGARCAALARWRRRRWEPRARFRQESAASAPSPRAISPGRAEAR